MLVGSPFLFGYAKPVPVELGNLRNPKRDMAWVALAGPGANLVMALMWMVAADLAAAHGRSRKRFSCSMAQAGVLTNLVIFAFNLFPIPPLDGGRVLTSLLAASICLQVRAARALRIFHRAGLVFLKRAALLDGAGHGARAIRR